ncbi:8750_t:CDS:1 [Paraglomus brasilianum]|uniref:8750_t:CDS:1 n=1 Tax=Paraglomus brasilianum TaxID=144538 RepID=A0A9N8VSK1_9GLOM|nr:8750_t:CDS:1 [Paraglomus brasilianum]
MPQVVDIPASSLPLLSLVSAIFGGALLLLITIFLHICSYWYYSRSRLLLITLTGCIFSIFRLIVGLCDWSLPDSSQVAITSLILVTNIIAFTINDVILFLRIVPYSKSILTTRIMWGITAITKIVLFAVVDEPRETAIGLNQYYLLKNVALRRQIFNILFAIVSVVWYGYMSHVAISHLRERGLLTTGHIYGPTNDHAVKLRRFLHVSIEYAIIGMVVTTFARIMRAVLPDGTASVFFFAIAISVELTMVPMMIKLSKEQLRHGLKNNNKPNDVESVYKE